jgi:hypothetical protein
MRTVANCHAARSEAVIFRRRAACRAGHFYLLRKPGSAFPRVRCARNADRNAACARGGVLHAAPRAAARKPGRFAMARRLRSSTAKTAKEHRMSHILDIRFHRPVTPGDPTPQPPGEAPSPGPQQPDPPQTPPPVRAAWKRAPGRYDLNIHASGAA